MKYLSEYLDFILESIQNKTARLYYSVELTSILERIESKDASGSYIAGFLLSSQDTSKMVDDYTMIDITDKNDTISFAQVSRILRKYPDMILSIEPFVDNKKITDPGSEFWKTNRQEMKIGRWVKRLTENDGKKSITWKVISDKEIEDFVNLYKATFDSKDDTKFELVSGEDIRKWYLYTNYDNAKGQLGASCMRYTNCQPYLDIYVKNPEVCQLLILKNDEGDKILGRALVWKLNDGRYYMDRVYTNRDSDKIVFEEWADKKGMVSFGTKTKSKDGDLEVKLSKGDFENFPYMDSFVCFDPKNLILSDDDDLWPGKGYYLLQETTGGYKNWNVVWSKYSEEYIDKDTAVYCKNTDDWVNLSEASYLEYKDEYASKTEDVVKSLLDNNYYYRDDAVWSETLGYWIYDQNPDLIEIFISSTGRDWCLKQRTDLYVEYNDIYYCRKRSVKDPYDGKYYFFDSKIDGEKYRKFLYEKIKKDISNGEEKSQDDLFYSASKYIVEVYNKGEFPRDKILEEISKNVSFTDDLQKTYWGVPNSNLPNQIDIIPALVGWAIYEQKFNTSSSFISSTTIRNFTEICIKISNESGLTDTAKKYWKVFLTDQRIIKIIAKICDNFDYEKFGVEFYKRYLFIKLLTGF